MPSPEDATSSSSAPAPQHLVDDAAVAPVWSNDAALQLFIGSVHDYAIFLLDPLGRVVTWNAGAARIKGYTEAQILGKHFSIFYPVEEIRGGKPAYELATATAVGRFEDEGWRLRQDGTRFWANVVITALRDRDGQLVGFGKVTRDLTERKKREEESEALAVAKAAQTAAEENAIRMEEFLQVIAHDVRQPLTSIDAQAQMLIRALQKERYDRAQTSAATILSATRRIDALLTNLVDSVRLESGSVPLTLEVVALGEFLRDLFQRYAGAFPAKRIQLKVPETTVLADPHHLERILTNLVTNALKYSPPESRVSVWVEECSVEVIVRVADQGIGIPPDDVPHIFERGFRTEEAKVTGPGSGLGLFIVSELVRALHGRIWVESQPHHGSTFSVALPRPIA